MLSSVERFTRLLTWPVPWPPQPITPMRMRSLAPKAEAGMTLASETEPAARAEVLTNSRRVIAPRCVRAGCDVLECMIGRLTLLGTGPVKRKNPRLLQLSTQLVANEPLKKLTFFNFSLDLLDQNMLKCQQSLKLGGLLVSGEKESRRLPKSTNWRT